MANARVSSFKSARLPNAVQIKYTEIFETKFYLILRFQRFVPQTVKMEARVFCLTRVPVLLVSWDNSANIVSSICIRNLPSSYIVCIKGVDLLHFFSAFFLSN